MKMTGIKEFEYIKEPRVVDLENFTSVKCYAIGNGLIYTSGIIPSIHIDDLGYHSDTGWEVYGKPTKENGKWITEFEAENKEKGYIVFGEFENEYITGNSLEAINDFRYAKLVTTVNIKEAI